MAYRGIHLYDRADRACYLRYKSGGGWFIDEPRISTVIGTDTDYRLTPEQRAAIDAECDAQWAEEMERAGGDSARALKAYLSRRREVQKRRLEWKSGQTTCAHGSNGSSGN
jgi:hypothetical protein